MQCDEVVIKGRSLDWLEGQVLTLQGLMAERDQRVRELEGRIGHQVEERGGGWCGEESDLDNEEEEEDVKGGLDQDGSASFPPPLPLPFPSPMTGSSKPKVVWRQVQLPASPAPCPSPAALDSNALASGPSKRLQAALTRRSREREKLAGKVQELEAKMGN